MKKPRNLSNEQSLRTGTVDFVPNGAFLGSTRITVAVTPKLKAGDIVAITVDDRNGDFPVPIGTLALFGGISVNGDVQVHMVNASAIPVAHNDIFVNWMVLPK